MEEDELLEAWVGLTSVLKNSRLTDGLSYNESIIMMLMYKQYQKDGIGQIPVSSILEHTRMLKSLVNRTINLLEKKKMLTKQKDSKDSRKLYVQPTEEGMQEFFKVHQQSLMLACNIRQIIGDADADAIIRAYHKLQNTQLQKF